MSLKGNVTTCLLETAYCPCSVRSRWLDDQLEEIRSTAWREHIRQDFEETLENCSFVSTMHRERTGEGLDAKPAKLIQAQLSCDRWCCIRCRTRILIPRWLENLAKHFSNHSWLFISELHGKWDNIRRSASRKVCKSTTSKFDFARVSLGDDHSFVVATFPFFPDAIRHQFPVAFSKVRSVIVDSLAVRKFIHTSRDWALPKPNKSNFKRLTNQPRRVELTNELNRREIPFHEYGKPDPGAGSPKSLLSGISAVSSELCTLEQAEELAYRAIVPEWLDVGQSCPNSSNKEEGPI